MSLPCECCVLSARGLCDEPITRPEEYYAHRIYIGTGSYSSSRALRTATCFVRYDRHCTAFPRKPTSTNSDEIRTSHHCLCQHHIWSHNTHFTVIHYYTLILVRVTSLFYRICTLWTSKLHKKHYVYYLGLRGAW